VKHREHTRGPPWALGEVVGFVAPFTNPSPPICAGPTYSTVQSKHLGRPGSSRDPCQLGSCLPELRPAGSLARWLLYGVKRPNPQPTTHTRHQNFEPHLNLPLFLPTLTVTTLHPPSPHLGDFEYDRELANKQLPCLAPDRELPLISLDASLPKNPAALTVLSRVDIVINVVEGPLHQHF
jgi:hypothetical protein